MRAFDDHSGETGTPSDGAGGAGGAGGTGGVSGGPHRAVPMPEGVADTPAGAALAALLEGLPVQQVSGFDTVEYLKAAHRLANHYQAVFLEALLETGLRVPGPDDQVNRSEVPGEFPAEEARAALVWSRTRAEGTFGRAYQMFGQYPQVGAALRDARLDEPRAKAFCDWTAGLADEHASRIIDELIPAAAKVTLGELIDRIKKMAIALDPEWAERRYNDAVRERRVELRQNPDGTANLTGRELPADRAKTGADRIHTLAKSCKNAGDSRRIATIRSDLFLGMLDGLYQQMTDQQIIDHVLANPVADDHTDDDDGNAPDGPGNDDGPGDDDGPSDDDGPGGNGSPGDDDGPSDDGHRAEAGGPAASGSSPTDVPESDPGTTDDMESTGPAPSGTFGANADPDIGRADTAAVPASDAFASLWNVAELRVELATLLGLNQHPAELPGLGYIPAAVARPLAARMASAEWRFVICTPDGVPICSGITSRRPTSRRDVRRDPKRGGILELQLTTAQLDQLATDVVSGQHSDWADVINDIADRYHRGIVDGRSAANTADAYSGVGTARAPVDVGQGADDARRRFARAGLRRWIEARARYCQHPACRMPATQCDHDHRTDYARGGLTVDQNLDPGCRHDHRLQHDGGWIVYRPPGSDPLTGPIIWVSPLGHEYESRPPPVMQPYPEPGNHYPGHDTLPEWITKLAENAKAAQQAARTAGATTATDGEPAGRPRRATAVHSERPPF